MLDLYNYILTKFNINANIMDNHLIVSNEVIIGSIYQEENHTIIDIPIYKFKARITISSSNKSYISGVLDNQTTIFKINYQFKDDSNCFYIINNIIYTVFIDSNNYKLAIMKNNTESFNNNKINNFCLQKLKERINF